MDVINEIIRQSAIGPFSNWFKSAVLTLFSSIVVTLFTMLILLIKYGPDTPLSFGY
ncbi:hypothetical protein [Poritiphilus flavus]|uniref:Uncharacterized protein n=1 Tax=Poritiphilus flavus TaxID=2697053 RepID=A0A6L9EF62_9FLAO|nr:hypothetical protein [Poritiphilus flavus]NAS13212.1 hypothetical protein [Poritiphilus flavus]